MNTLKDYAIGALVSTVDHLGTVTFKVNDLLDENINEVSGTELRVSCIEQVLCTLWIILSHICVNVGMKTIIISHYYLV